jgi:RNA polymerase sigma-70 factor (ECF subfamily)
VHPDDIDELARRAKAGDRDALEALLSEVRPRALAICRRVLADSHDAEDACQEALLRVALKLGSWNERARFTTWLRAVATNAALSNHRRRRNHPVVVDVPGLEKPDARSADVVTRVDFLAALRSLEVQHPQYVAPLVLRAVDGLDYREIAQRLGAPVGTVKSRVHFARKYVGPRLLEAV